MFIVSAPSLRPNAGRQTESWDLNMSCLWMKLAGLRSRPKANPSKDQPQADSETGKTKPQNAVQDSVG